jgi:type I restriction-modification system DNA methylase subunit
VGTHTAKPSTFPSISEITIPIAFAAPVFDAYDKEQDIDKFMRVVEMPEIKENDFNLNISRYIDTNEAEEEIDLKAVRESIALLEEKEKPLTGSRISI